MFQTTITNLTDSDAFVRAYTEPIRAAFRSLAFVDADEVDDLTQDLLVKLMGRDLVKVRSELRGSFRAWLYLCVRNHAIDALRYRAARPARTSSFEFHMPVDPSSVGDARPQDPDVLYALAILNLTLRQVRRHWERQGKPEVWRVFEELVLAPMIPGRVARTRDELMLEFPGRNRQYLDNCCTSVKRTIVRTLPAMIPPALTDFERPEERFEEWLSILLDSGTALCGQLHLAFGTDLPWEADPDADESMALARSSVGGVARRADAPVDPELGDSEHRVLLGIWLAMPMHWYLDPGSVDAALPGRPAREGEPTLLDVLSAPSPGGPTATKALRTLLEGLKRFAKRVHHSVSPDHDAPDGPEGRARRACSMTPEVAQTLYNLALALALVRCRAMIGSLDAGQLRKNLDWLLHRRWLDDRLRPTLREARSGLAARPAV